jgi:tRNA-dihydrouridine synthase A
MMDWTDRHCRAFHRTLSRRALLFTEMVTADAVIHGDRERLIGFSAFEHPVALQLGGCEPEKLAEAARIAAAFGYDEINLNCGCPSERVQSGAFGACLMREPALVADGLSAMGEAVDVPVTVKCRIAVDDDPPRETLWRFVDTLAAAGCEVFSVHARKAWLKGLSPKQNRDIPPLDYALVAALKRERPDLTIILNGGIASLDEAARHLSRFDGVMLGRAAYQTPALLAGVDAMLDRLEEGCASVPADGKGRGEDTLPGFDGRNEGSQGQDLAALLDAVERHRPYLAARLDEGVPLHAMTRHMLGLFSGHPGARHWRRTLSEQGVKPGAGLDVLDAALAPLRQRVGRAAA